MRQTTIPSKPAPREIDIINWGVARNLIGPTGEATMLGQLDKTREEVEEIGDAIALLVEHERPGHYQDALDMVRDAIGDVYVTLVMHAQQWGLTVDECVEQAWSQIKDRKGRMVDGIFVKEA